MKGRWAVGVDGGGTKTAVLAAQTGVPAIRRSADAGPCNIAAMVPSDAFANVRAALSSLELEPHDIAAICLGVAGYSAADRRREFEALLRSSYPLTNIEITPDYVTAHSGAFEDGVGVVVIAGTGTIAYGVNGRGESFVCGGYGYLVDDLGSGYGLGRQVLAAAGRVFDGAQEGGKLFELFATTTGIRSREELIAQVYGGSLDRLSIASLSSLVSRASEAGDPSADALLMHAGGALARIAQTCLGRLFTEGEAARIAKIGSVWSAGGELVSVFERSIRRSDTGALFVEATALPVEGALRRALDLAKGEGFRPGPLPN